MSLGHNPQIATSGLILNLDASNPRSLSGVTRNLFVNTENLDTGSYLYSAGRYLITANSNTAPDGSVTADLLTNNESVNNFNTFAQRFTTTVADYYTMSYYVKNSTASTISVLLGTNNWDTSGGGGLYFRAVFDLATRVYSLPQLAADTGVPITIDKFTYGFTDVGNNWLRLWVTADLRSISNITNVRGGLYVGTYGSTSTSFGLNIWSWGWQLERESAPSTYYPQSASISTTWTDISGNSNNATLVNNPVYNGSAGGRLVFNGASQYCSTSLPAATTFTTDSDFSIACWLNFSAYKTEASSIGTIVGAFNFQGWGLYWQGTPTTYNIGSYMRYASVTSDVQSSAVVPSTWYYAVQSYSRSSNFHRLYINGVLSSSNTSISGAYSSNLNNVFMGIGYGVGSDGTPGGVTFGTPFLGSISQISVYNRALSAAEVSQNFNALRGRYSI